MRINSVNNQQNFKGTAADKVVGFIAKHPGTMAALAGSSVIAQKVVMSAAEATIGPAMDITIGSTISKVTNEKDGRTKKSSKVQAVRTFSQAVGGTFVGVIIRGLCIAGATALCMKLGEKAGQKLGETFGDKAINLINDGVDKSSLYSRTKNASDWGKNIGGAAALLVMLVTNFIIDVPIINAINKKAFGLVKKLHGKEEKTSENVENKEVK